MYNVGDYLIYKNYEVCLVEAIENPSFTRNSDKLYYKLTSVFANNKEIIYVPVDSHIYLRKTSDIQQIQSFMDVYKNLKPEIHTTNNNTLLTEHYQSLYIQGTTEAFLTIVKEILIKELEAKENRKQLRQTDKKYLEQTLKPLCEEFAFVLNQTPDEIKEFFKQNI